MRRLHFSLLVAVLTLAAIPTAQQQPAGDWPRWRGAGFDGTAAGSGAFDKPFELRVRWKKTLGPGYSGVVVAAGRAITMFSDGTDDVVAALDADSGQEIWRTRIAPTYPGRDGSTGGPVSTPAVEDGTVFALGPRGEFLALDAATGRQVWKRQLTTEFGAAVPHWGFTTSPLVTGDHVIVLAGGANGHAVVALNRRTGELEWKAGDDSASYGSPILATVGGRQLVIAGGDKWLVALDPKTGREAWRIEHGGVGFYGRIINPVVVGDGLLLTSKPDQSALLKVGGGAPAPGWTTRELKLSYSTPVVYRNLVFGYSGAFLTAIDVSTGERKWRSRPPGDGFPILVDRHLVVLTKEGRLAIGEASDTSFEEKASLDLFSRLVWTPPAFAHGRIYARDSYESVAAVDVVPSRRMTTTDPNGPPARGVIPGSRFAQWVTSVAAAPDAQKQVDAFVASQQTHPIVEGERYAHILFKGDGSDLLLRSDALGTGVDWALHRVGNTDLYYASLELEPDSRISYQFVRTFGDTLPDPKNPLKAASQNFAGEVSLLFMPKADRALPAAATLRGKLMDLEFDGGKASAAHLQWNGKRPVQVYLPPGYDADPAKRYPSIYVMYGEEMLKDGRLAAALDQEMNSRIAPAIVVFVHSTNAYEYARTFRDAHARMMGERIVPWIDDRFRTRASAQDRILIGGDEAGYAAVEVGLRYPNVFGGIVAQSLFPLSTGDTELLALIDKTPKTTQRFYVDWGRYDPRRQSDRLDVPGFSARVSERLKARGHDVDGRGWNDGSTTIFWSARAVGALRKMLPVR